MGVCHLAGDCKATMPSRWAFAYLPGTGVKPDQILCRITLLYVWFWGTARAHCSGCAERRRSSRNQSRPSDLERKATLMPASHRRTLGQQDNHECMHPGPCSAHDRPLSDGLRPADAGDLPDIKTPNIDAPQRAQCDSAATDLAHTPVLQRSHSEAPQ